MRELPGLAVTSTLGSLESPGSSSCGSGSGSGSAGCIVALKACLGWALNLPVGD